MLFRHRMATLALFLLAGSGCERAHRFPVQAPKSTDADVLPVAKVNEPPKISPIYGWRQPNRQPLDIPLRFVSSTADEWPSLKGLWNEFPARVGLQTWPLGLMPFEAASAFTAQAFTEVIKIKVPRGLPDPTPFTPASNPPTFAKWLLGKKLFFDRSLLEVSTTTTRSCADCHNPQTAYTVNTAKPVNGKWNVPSLINSVYNRHQFWDGRAVALEEVLERQLSDQKLPIEDPPSDRSPGYLHVFPGLIDRLGGKQEYLRAFEYVFASDPSVDSVAKALATYMRTLLSGDSVYDQADENRRKRKGEFLAAEDVEPALSPEAMKLLPSTLTSKEAAQQIVRGYAVFQGRAACQECHSGNLFTDNDFHNVGIGESKTSIHGKEPGRFAVVPYGLKDRRLIGAFKTPSLRNLQLTGPYMHDGSLPELADVIAHFNSGLANEPGDYLDPRLLTTPHGLEEGPQPVRLALSPADLAALEIFLRSLRGNDLPKVLTEMKLQ